MFFNTGKGIAVNHCDFGLSAPQCVDTGVRLRGRAPAFCEVKQHCSICTAHLEVARADAFRQQALCDSQLQISQRLHLV